MLFACWVTICLVLVALSEQISALDDKNDVRSTQPTLERQVDAPSAAPAPSKPASEASPVKPKKESSLASQKKAAALAAQQNYDKYQLKATNSYASTQPIAAAAGAGSPPAASGEKASVEKSNGNNNNNNKDDNVSNNGNSNPNKKAGSLLVGQANNQKQKSSSFSLLKKLFPSFMSSPSASTSSSSSGSSALGSVAAAAAAATAAAVSSSSDNRLHAGQHSRSTGDGPFSKQADAGARIINLWRRNSSSSNHAPPLSFLLPKKQSAIDRQGGAAASIASGLLSNPLGLGLLFSAPLLPSLLLTPLAIAGLSPAMSAINNLFGDDDETSSPAPAGPFAALTGGSGSNSALASILQATGALPAPVATPSSEGGASSPSPANSFAMQAFQTLLGQPSTTERPLFNPGMFASSGIQNAVGSLTSGSSSSSSSPSSTAGNALASAVAGSSSSSSPIRNSFFGGNLIQTAASMISPSFAAPPAQASGSTAGSSGGASNAANSNNDDDDGPGLMQMASGVFEKVANFMGTDNNNNNKDIAQASSQPQVANAPLSTLAALSNFSPFQLSSLFGPTPLGSAVSTASSHHSHGHGAGHQNTQRAGFFSTLRNVYELFSSSFLRRQAESGDNSNECQQRLICELHQRAMNSKLFRRSVQANLMELANIDRSMLEQLKLMPQFAQARVDSDTKAMLNDFLKATNNYKSGRELINCSRMFPKCSRAQLLVAANAHLSDPINGKAIGKFSQLMKKMKYKSNQQHQSQWKLRKSSPPSSKPVLLNGQVSPLPAASNPIDFMQVAPMSPTLNGQQSQLSPADSLKLVQQIMLMSQMNQPQQPYAQQQQQQQPQPQQQMVVAPQQYVAPSMPANSQYRSQQPTNGYSTSGSPQQYSNSYNQYPSQAASTTYTDAVYAPATDSPYYLPQQPQQQQQQQQYIEQQPSQIQQQQPQPQQQQQVVPTNQSYQQAPVMSMQDDKSKASGALTSSMGAPQAMKTPAVAA